MLNRSEASLRRLNQRFFVRLWPALKMTKRKPLSELGMIHSKPGTPRGVPASLLPDALWLLFPVGALHHILRRRSVVSDHCNST
jgi:hypothetical protein